MVRSSRLIAIPAYNEASTIASVIKHCQSLSFSEVLVVDDGSSDDTVKIALECGCEVIRHNINRGYEYALNTAYRYAIDRSYEELHFIDADGEHGDVDLREFSFSDDNFLAKIGSRDRKNRLAEYISAFISKIRYGISDPYCGLKSYNLNQISKYELTAKPGDMIGTSLVREIANKVGRKNLGNVPLKVRKRKGLSRFSQSNLKANIILLLNILK